MTHRPRKRFGQHFLHDRRVIERMMEAIEPRAGETFVEIGPGTGALTRPLLERTGELDAIELDRDLAERLERLSPTAGALRIHRQDALAVDIPALRRCGRPLRVVGNLPYNVSTPLLFHTTQWGDAVTDLHFLLQKEVVERMAAGPGGGTYGRLSVMIQYRCRVQPLFDVPSGAFRPPPRVTSTFVRLVPHGEPPVPVRDPAALETVVGHAFSQRRKTLRNALRPLLAAEEIAAAGVDPGLRPEALDLAAFARLANSVPVTSRMR